MKTSSWAAPAAVALYRAAASGQGQTVPPQDRAIGPAGHDTVRCHGQRGIMIRLTETLARAGRDVPVRKISSWAAPAAVAQSRYRAAARTGQGHRAGGPFKLYSPRSRSLAGSDSVTEALARTGRPSQKDFKLGGPRCSGCCTVPDRHRTGPSGRRAIIQSEVKVPGGIMIRLTEALARAGRPSQDDFKLGGPRCCLSCTVPGCGHRTGPLGQQSNIQSVTVCGHCPGSLSRAGYMNL